MEIAYIVTLLVFIVALYLENRIITRENSELRAKLNQQKETENHWHYERN